MKAGGRDFGEDTAADSCDVNSVANGELIDGDFLSNLETVDRIETNFDETPTWLDTSLGKVTCTSCRCGYGCITELHGAEFSCAFLG